MNGQTAKDGDILQVIIVHTNERATHALSLCLFLSPSFQFLV